MRARPLGLLAVVVVVALDRAAKLVVLGHFDQTASTPIPLTPFLDLALRWNRGISFSLFAQESATGRWLLLALTLSVTALIAFWLWRARAPLVGLGLGAIVGGAIGNGYDRMVYGAVIDFLDLHAFGRNFFVFNLADAAINLGVALLILDGLIGALRGSDKAGQPP
ncbi:MAG: signal peptidase II [Bradyrhizobium sp.]|nr:MAG: signal peptidase II [Bradyrhizobium sp.]